MAGRGRRTVVKLPDMVAASPEKSPFMDSLFKKMEVIEENVNNLCQIASTLMDSWKKRQVHAVAVQAELETLKMTKVDIEEVVNALAQKVDEELLSTRISHDRHFSITSDFSRALQEVVRGVSHQDDKLERSVIGAMHQIEKGLNDYVDCRFKDIEGRLEAISKLKEEMEARGTKVKPRKKVTFVSPVKEFMEDRPRISPPGARSPSRNLAYKLHELHTQQMRFRQERNRLRDGSHMITSQKHLPDISGKMYRRQAMLSEPPTNDDRLSPIKLSPSEETARLSSRRRAPSVAASISAFYQTARPKSDKLDARSSKRKRLAKNMPVSRKGMQSADILASPPKRFPKQKVTDEIQAALREQKIPFNINS
ncbi:uncharacterized protein LOC110835562 isoform X1 [Zootermopsis nevadensis]|uniref:DUF4795 domain-containing protein n=1 Tax=Zootermopsis nevadensis TaxID=136037 RepID=A0A067R573_ZOONE|nr:uncharacterized protein LOC110835562 isoform X1 [Zootermopsis nevadensis]KDR13234.1 hypothetical protein L798_12854 [Zootermopsis nevadensis]